jgi:hypothetical protein
MYTKSFSITGKHIMMDEGKFFISNVEDPKFRSTIAQLYEFVADTNADCDAAYDWVCDQCDLLSFVADEWAWDMFYNVWQSAYDVEVAA